jgi:hypothetical protein
MNAQPAEQIKEIRDLMERSSRFISLSGLSGVGAGIIALAGALYAFFYLDYDLRYLNPDEYFGGEKPYLSPKTLLVLLLDAAIVFTSAIAFAIILTTRKARKSGQKIWTHSTRQLLANLLVPLAAGGVFCIALLYHGIIYLIAPATLLFYGLALLNASKYTLSEIRWLGITEMLLGLTASIIPGYGLLVWAIGFGILHIIYGMVMYLRYER